jgi:hypothetical protein
MESFFDRDNVESENDLQSFPCFSLLPPEIRHKIWAYSLPRRLLYPRMTGYSTSLSPPNITRVSRESRGVAMLHGGPRSIDKAKKTPSSTWFDPRCDVVLLDGSRPSKTWEKSYAHPICSSIWQAAASIVVADKFVNVFGSGTDILPLSRHNITKHAIDLAIQQPSIREIAIGKPRISRITAPTKVLQGP